MIKQFNSKIASKNDTLQAEIIKTIADISFEEGKYDAAKRFFQEYLLLEDREQ